MALPRWRECRGDLMAEGARSLQRRLRDRFRVAAVNYHLRRNLRMAGRGYFSSTVQRWIDRFSDFRRESLPSTSTFYRKRGDHYCLMLRIFVIFVDVSKDIDAEDDSVLTRMLQAIAVPVIGNVCHVFMHGLNRVQIFGIEKLQHAVLHRPENKSLITVSNHVAAMDDPLVIASLLSPSMLFDANELRWTLCATDRCFTNPVTSAFFKYVKVLPVSRGDGLYQKGMDLAISKLNRNGWVHIFPEGSRSRDGGKTVAPAKRGIGRLVLDADSVPLVVPFVHTGMQDVMPRGASFPRIGKTVTILVGDPICFDDLIEGEKKNIPRGQLYDTVSTRISNHLQMLKLKVETLAMEQGLQWQNSPRATERAAHLLQNIDWESHGIVNHMTVDINSPRHQHLCVEPDNIKQHSNEEHCFGRSSSFSSEGGFVSRIRGYMEPTELMIFAARGLFSNRRTHEYFPSLEVVSPLKTWNNIWKSMSGNHHYFLPCSEAMQY